MGTRTRVIGNVISRVSNLILGVTCLSLVDGCGLIMAGHLPESRPPEEIRAGLDRANIDRNYGFPIAFSVDDSGCVVEQIQFVDGVSKESKHSRIVVHGVLDYCTICIWELVATPFEVCSWAIGYPTYVYFLEFDENEKLVRAVNAETPEGMRYQSQPWAVPVRNGVAKRGLEFNDSAVVHNALIDEITKKAFSVSDGKLADRHVGDFAAHKTLYELTSFRRDNENGLSYHFVLNITAREITFNTVAAIRRDLYKEIIADYAETHAIRDRSTLNADLVRELKLSDRKMEGDVAVFSATPVALMDYDSENRKGRITIRFNAGVNQDVARKWAIKNIETLVRSKNMLLTTGVQPPPGNYMTLSEEWHENELVMTFNSE